MAVGAPDPADLDDPTFFDGDTVRDGYVYGWLSSGLAYEAIPVGDEPSYSVPVAPTARIEIWCSPTGDDGSYTYCGDTLTDWTHHDEHPAIGVPLWYMARAFTEAGAWADSDPVSVVAWSESAYLHYTDRDGVARTVRGGWSPTLNVSGGRASSRQRYAGDDVDTVHWGARMPRTHALQVAVVPGDHGSSLREWLAASEHPGTVLYRGLEGELLTGALGAFSWSGSSSIHQRVSFTVTEGK